MSRYAAKYWDALTSTWASFATGPKGQTGPQGLPGPNADLVNNVASLAPISTGISGSGPQSCGPYTQLGDALNPGADPSSTVIRFNRRGMAVIAVQAETGTACIDRLMFEIVTATGVVTRTSVLQNDNAGAPSVILHVEAGDTIDVQVYRGSATGASWKTCYVKATLIESNAPIVIDTQPPQGGWGSWTWNESWQSISGSFEAPISSDLAYVEVGYSDVDWNGAFANGSALRTTRSPRSHWNQDSASFAGSHPPPALPPDHAWDTGNPHGSYIVFSTYVSEDNTGNRIQTSQWAYTVPQTGWHYVPPQPVEVGHTFGAASVTQYHNGGQEGWDGWSGGPGKLFMGYYPGMPGGKPMWATVRFNPDDAGFRNAQWVSGYFNFNVVKTYHFDGDYCNITTCNGPGGNDGNTYVWTAPFVRNGDNVRVGIPAAVGQNWLNGTDWGWTFGGPNIASTSDYIQITNGNFSMDIVVRK